MPASTPPNISFIPAEGRRRRGHHIGPILLGAAQPGSHPHAERDRAPHREHDALAVVDAHENRQQLAIPLA
jgi:hypothetical protein